MYQCCGSQKAKRPARCAVSSATPPRVTFLYYTNHIEKSRIPATVTVHGQGNSTFAGMPPGHLTLPQVRATCGRVEACRCTCFQGKREQLPATASRSYNSAKPACASSCRPRLATRGRDDQVPRDAAIVCLACQIAIQRNVGESGACNKADQLA